MFSAMQLALLAIFLAIIAIWQIFKLRTHLHIDDQTSTPKWRKAVHGPRFDGKSRVDVYPANTNPSQMTFFKATEKIVPLLNTWHSETPWSFEDEGRLELEPLDGAERRIVIRHGQQETGLLRISSISFDNDGAFQKTLKHSASGNLEIINARFWAFRDVYGIAVSVAGIIADDNEFGEAQRQAMLSALDCMWEIGPRAFGNPDFEYSVSGKGLARLNGS